MAEPIEYIQAANILKTDVDPVRLLYWIAQQNPAAIIQAAQVDEVYAPLIPQWHDAVLSGSLSKIQAIKEYRSLTGVGLKDAKDFIEGLVTR